MVGQTLKNCQLNSGRGNAHLSNGSWTNNRTDTTWTTYGGISNNGKALGLPSTSMSSTTITFTVQIDSGYTMNVKSFSFYDRSSNTGYKNWSMTINGVAVGTDTTFVDCSGCSNAVRSTGTIAVTNPVNITGTATFALILSNKGSGSSGTFRIDSFIVNGNINPIYDIAGNSVYANKIYRYGFNNKENDNEVEGQGNWQDYGMRMYSPRLGRFPSVDPLKAKYPYLTPYQFASNSPISGVDLDGLEYYSNFNYTKDLKTGKTTLKVENGIYPQYQHLFENGNTPPATSTTTNYYLTVINNKGESEKFTLNSSTTSKGRDKPEEKVKDGSGFTGDFTGVTKLTDDNFATLIAFGLDVIQPYIDNHTGGVLTAIRKETKNENTLDYKFSMYKTLNIPWNNLVEYRGVTYNANEAGNLVWSALFEYYGLCDIVPGDQSTPGLLADIFTRGEALSRLDFKNFLGGDSYNEQQAIKRGQTLGGTLKKDKSFSDNVNKKRTTK